MDDKKSFFFSIVYLFLVSWSKGIHDLTNSGRCMKETFGNYVRLTMKRATILDSGTYFVLAKNLYGTDRAFVTVKVKIIFFV